MCGDVQGAEWIDPLPASSKGQAIVAGDTPSKRPSRPSDLRPPASGLRPHPHRLLILGLDCLEPSLAFHRWAHDLPNITALRERGLWGPLRSTDPPITVPAWMSMCTSRDPGELGIYGFRNRRSYEYGDLFIVNSSYVKFPTLWETIGAAGGSSIVLGVPLTFPPKPFAGKLACSFLAPGKDVQWTHPKEFARDLDELAGGDYIVDVTSVPPAPSSRGKRGRSS